MICSIFNSATRNHKLHPLFKKFATVPFIERDIAFIVDADIPQSVQADLIRRSGIPLLEHVELIDRYSNLSEENKETLREEGKLDQLESEIIKQGLDLKGGMYIALEADIPTLVKNLATNQNEKFEKVLNATIDQFKSNQNQLMIK